MTLMRLMMLMMIMLDNAAEDAADDDDGHQSRSEARPTCCASNVSYGPATYDWQRCGYADDNNDGDYTEHVFFVAATRISLLCPTVSPAPGKLTHP